VLRAKLAKEAADRMREAASRGGKASGASRRGESKASEPVREPSPATGKTADGVLKKRGAWWQVLDWDRLPEYVVQKIQNVKNDRRDGACVQLAKHDPRILGRLKQPAPGPRTPGEPLPGRRISRAEVRVSGRSQR
jgi:hypothetical protein